MSSSTRSPTRRFGRWRTSRRIARTARRGCRSTFVRLAGHADATVAPGDLTVSTRPLSTATPTQWALVQQIHAAIADAQVQLRERIARMDARPAAPRSSDW